MSGSLQIEAASTANIIGGAVSGTFGKNWSLAGSGTVNLVTDQVSALLGGDDGGISVNANAGSVTVDATDTPTIYSLAGGIAIAKSSAAVGAAIAVNVIGDAVAAEFEYADLTVSGDTDIEASTQGKIEALAVAGAFSTQAWDFAGSATANIISDSVDAESNVTSLSAPVGQNPADVTITAGDSSTIESLAGALSFSTSATVGAGAGLAINVIENGITAAVNGGSLDALDFTLSASSTPTIESGAVGIGIAFGGKFSGMGGIAVNVIGNNVTSVIDNGASVLATDNAGVIALSNDNIEMFAGALDFSGATLGGGLGVAINVIAGSTTAEIDNASVTALASAQGDTIQVPDGTLTLPFALSGIGSITGFADNYSSLGGLEEDNKAITGLAVDAANVENIGAVGGTAALSGGTAALAATVVVNSMGGTTTAEIANATINLGPGTPGAGQQVVVIAGSHDFAGTFSLSLAGASTGGGAVAAVGDLFDGTTDAFITEGSSVSALDAVEVTADSTADGISLGVGVGIGGTLGGAGTIVIAHFIETTDADIDGSGVTAPAVSIDATNADYSNIIAGNGAFTGTVAIGGVFVIVVNDDTTTADLGQSGDTTDVTADGSVGVAATTSTTLDGLAVSGAISGVAALSVMAVVDALTDTTQAVINNATIAPASSFSPAPAVSVSAYESATLVPWAGNLAGAGTVAAGFGLTAALVQSTVEANVIDSAITGSSVAITAQGVKDIEPVTVDLAIGLAGGGAGIGGSLILVGGGGDGGFSGTSNQTSDGTTSDTLGGELGSVDTVSSGGGTFIDSATGLSEATAASLASGFDTTFTNLIGDNAPDLTQASVQGSSTITANSLSLTATATTGTRNIAGALGGGLGVGVGAGIGFTDIYNTVSVFTSSGTTIHAPSISLDAQAGDGSVATAEVNSYVGSGGIIALSAALAWAEVDNTVTAELGGTVDPGLVGASDAFIGISAKDTSTLAANGIAAEIGGLTGGVVDATALKSSTVIADVAPGANVTQSFETVSVDGFPLEVPVAAFQVVSVNASDSGSVAAATIAAGLGVISANGAVSDVSDNSQVDAFIGGGASIVVDTGLNLGATATPDVAASAIGVTVGLAAGLGASVADATASPMVSAFIGNQATVNGPGEITISAATQTPAGTVSDAVPIGVFTSCGQVSSCAFAAGGSGGLLVGVNATIADASGNAVVAAYTGGGVTVGSGNLTIAATDDMSVLSDATGVAAGIVAIGANLASSDASGGATAYLGPKAVTPTADEGGTGAITIDAQGTDTVVASATAGAGGLVAGSGASASTSDSTTTAAAIEGPDDTASSAVEALANPTIVAGAVTISAQHTANFDSESNTIQASLLGGSGSLTSDTITTIATASIDAETQLEAASLVMTAENLVTRINAGNDNVQAGAGGVANGSAGEQQSTIIAAATVTIGQGANIVVAGNALLQASNTVTVSTEADLDTGGAVDGAAATAIDNVGQAATIDIDNGATLDAGGDIGAFAANFDDVSAVANVHTYGAVGISTGVTEANVTSDQTINIGTDSCALAGGCGAGTMVFGNTITLVAGESADGAIDTQAVAAVTNVNNYSIIPIDTAPTANASLDTTSSVSIASNANLLSVGDITLSALAGVGSVSGQSVDTNIYEEVTQDVINGILGLFGDGSVSLAVTGGSSTVSATDTVTVDGAVDAGDNYLKTLSIDANGIITANGIAATPSTFDLYDTLGAQLVAEAAVDDDPNASADQIALAQGEIEQIENQLTALQQYGTAAQNVPLISIGEVEANGGNIFIAGTLSGSGTLVAHGNPLIDIENGSNSALSIQNLTIGEAGGAVAVNNVFHSNGDVVNGVHVSIVEGSSAGPLIQIENTAADVPSGVMPPDIYLNGALTNSSGAVTIFNALGSVYLDQTASINANSVSIIVPQGNYIQNFTPGFTFIGGAVTDDGDGSAGGGSITVGGSVFIAAEYIDINGTIESGEPQWSVTLDPNLALSVSNAPEFSPQNPGFSLLFSFEYETRVNGQLTFLPWTLGELITFYAEQYAQSVFNATIERQPASSVQSVYPLLGPTPAMPTQLTVSYDAATQQVVIGQQSIQAGNIYLYGNIFSTGNGHLYASSGYGQISITNGTTYPVVVNTLSTGTGQNGQIEIVDTSQTGNTTTGSNGQVENWPLATLYIYNWQTGAISEYQNTGAGDASNASTLVATTSGYVTSYQPNNGGGLGGLGGAYFYYNSLEGLVNELTNAAFEAFYGISFNIFNPATLDRGPQSLTNAITLTMFLNDTITIEDNVLISDFEAGNYAPITAMYGAAYPVDVEFNHELGGNGTGGISIVSPNANIVIAGGITNPAGSTTLTATDANIVQPTAGTTIETTGLTLQALSIGASSAGSQPIGVTIESGGSVSAVATFGDVYLAAPESGLPLAAAIAYDGNVNLTAQGDIVGLPAAGLTPTVIGQNISLTSQQGAIYGMNFAQALFISSGATGGTGELDAQASGSIAIVQLGLGKTNLNGSIGPEEIDGVTFNPTSGNLFLGQVISFGGTVSLSATGGIFNNLGAGTVNTALEQQLAALYAGEHLIYDPSVETQQQADEALGAASATAFQNQVNANYQQYFSIAAFAVNGQVTLTAAQAAAFAPQVVAYYQTLNPAYSGTPTAAQVTEYLQARYAYLTGFFQGLYTGVGTPPTQAAYSSGYSYAVTTTRGAVSAPQETTVDGDYATYWNIKTNGVFNAATGTVTLNGQDVTAEYDMLQGLFNGLYDAALPSAFTTFNAQYAYVPSTSSTLDQLSTGAAWTQTQLTDAINVNALTPTANTQIFIATPNVVGANVTLDAGASIGNAGNADTYVVAPGSTPSTALLADLAAAAPGDVQVSSPASDGDVTITVFKTLPVNIEATGSNGSGGGTLTATAAADIFLGAQGSVALASVSNSLAGAQIRITAGGSILDGGSSDEPVITGAKGGLDLEAAGPSGSGNGIGNTTAPLLVAVGGNLDYSAASGDTYLEQTSGNLSLGNIYAGGNLALTASSGSVLSEFDDPSANVVHIQANSITLDASGGIGAASDPLHIALPNGGTLSASAGGNIDILNPAAAVSAGAGIVIGSGGLTAGGAIDLEVESGDLSIPYPVLAGGQIDFIASGNFSIIGGEDTIFGNTFPVYTTITSTNGGISVSAAAIGVPVSVALVEAEGGAVTMLSTASISFNGGIGSTFNGPAAVDLISTNGSITGPALSINAGAPDATVNLAAAGDIGPANVRMSFATVSSTSGNINLEASSGNSSAVFTSLSALGGTITLTSQEVSLAIGTATSSGTQNISAPLGVSFTALATTGIAGDPGNIILGTSAGSIIGGSIVANGAVTLSAGMTLAALLGGGDPGVGLAVSTIRSGGTLTLGAGNDITFETLATTGIPGDAGNIVLSSTYGSISGGSATANGSVELTANLAVTLAAGDTIGSGGALTVEAASIAMGAGSAMTASGPLSLTATSGDMILGAVEGSAITITSAGAILGNGDGQINLTLGGTGTQATLTAATGIGTSALPLSLEAGTLSASTAAGGIDLAPQLATTLPTLSAPNGTVTVDEFFSTLTLGTVTSGGSQSYTAPKDISFTQLTATGIAGDAGNIAIKSNFGAITGGTIAANGSVSAIADEGNISFTLAAGGDAEYVFTDANIAIAGLGGFTFGTLNGSTVTLTASGSISGTDLIADNASVTAGGAVAITETLVGSFSASAASGDIWLTLAADDIASSIVASAGSIAITARDGLTFGTLQAGQNVTVTAPGDLTGSTIVAGGTATLEAGTTLDVGTITSGGTQTISAPSGISFTQLTTTGISGDAGDIGVTTSGGTIAGGSISSSGGVTLNAPLGSIDLVNSTSADNQTATTGGAITFAAFTSTGGGITLAASGAITGTSVSAASQLNITAGLGGSGAITIVNLSAFGASVASPTGITIHTIEVDESVSLAAPVIDPTITQFPASSAPLVVSATGYQGTPAETITLDLETANPVMVSELSVVTATIHSTSSNLTIGNGYVADTLTLVTPSGTIVVDNESSGPVGNVEQLYQPGGQFDLSLSGGAITTDARVTNSVSGFTVLSSAGTVFGDMNFFAGAITPSDVSAAAAVTPEEMAAWLDFLAPPAGQPDVNLDNPDWRDKDFEVE